MKTLSFNLVVLLLLSFLGSQLILSDNQSAAFFLMPFRAWEFSIGGILATLESSNARKLSNRTVRSALTVSSVVILFLTAIFYSHKTTFPGVTALPVCIATGALIIFSRESILWPVLAHPVLTAIGRLSYSMYLVHWPLIVFYRDIKINYFPISMKVENSLMASEIVVLFILITGLSILLRNYIEWPFRYGVKTQLQMVRRRVVLITCTVVSLVLGTIVVITEGMPIRVNTEDFNRAMAENYHPQCTYLYESGPWKDYCGIGIQKMEPDIVFLGDSHALHFLVGFDYLLSELNLSGVIKWAGGSLPIPNGYSFVGGRKSSSFDEDYRKIFEKKPKLLVLSSRWDGHFKEQIPDNPGALPNRFMYGKHMSMDVESSINAVKSGLRDLFLQLDMHGVPTIVLGQVPLVVRNVRNCLLRPFFFSEWKSGCLLVPSKEQFEYQAEVVNALHEVSDNLNHIHVIDMVGFLCQDQSCEVMDSSSGYILYRDGDHLSPTGAKYVVSKYLKTYIAGALKSLLPQP